MTRAGAISLALLVVVATGCAGPGRGAAVPPGIASPLAQSGNAAAQVATLTVNIPKAGVGTAGADRRSPRYVSPGTLSMRVMAAPANSFTGFPAPSGTAVLGVYDLSPTGTVCTQTTANAAYSRSCVISVPIAQALAAYGTTMEFAVETYATAATDVSPTDPTTQAASILSEGIVPSSPVAKNGAAVINIVLGGVPVGFQPPGNQSSVTVAATNHTRQTGGTVLPLAAYDAAGNIIVGPYFGQQSAQVYSNTPDLAFNVTSAASTQLGVSYAVVSGSSDVLDLTYTGKGMLVGQISAFGITQYVTVTNVPAIDQYDVYDAFSAPGSANTPFANFQPEAIAVGSYNGGQQLLYVVSGGGPDGYPTLSAFAFNATNFALGSSYATCDISIPSGPYSPFLLIDANNAYFFEKSSGQVNAVALGSLGSQGAICAEGSAGPGAALSTPLAGATLAGDGSIWAITTGGVIARWAPNGAASVSATPVAPPQKILATGTAGGPLVGFSNVGTFSQGVVWLDATNQTVNAVDIGSRQLYRESPGYGVLSGQYAPGTIAFVDQNVNLDAGLAGGGTETLSPTGALGDLQATPNYSYAPFLAGSGSAPTRFVLAVENASQFNNGGITYGFYGAAGAPAGSRGLARYAGNAETTLPNIPNGSNVASNGTTPTTFVPAGAVLGPDSRVWFLSSDTTNGSYELYAFPGHGNASLYAQAKKRAPAGRTGVPR